jgi:hypothetical protein
MYGIKVLKQEPTLTQRVKEVGKETNNMNIPTKQSFKDATSNKNAWNTIVKWNGFNIATVRFHEGREWKIVKDGDTFSQVSERSYKPIAEFHTQEELWNYIKDTNNQKQQTVKNNEVEKEPMKVEKATGDKRTIIDGLTKDQSAFAKEFTFNYNRRIESQKRGELSPPIAGKNKGKQYIDESLAYDWAMRDTLATTKDSLDRKYNNTTKEPENIQSPKTQPISPSR